MKEISNPLEAFQEFPGPILLLAGPGTGKTFQIEHRVKFLIENEIAEPDEISIITFTNESAKSMRKRLSKSDLDNNCIPSIINTIHSLCNMIIGENFHLIDLPENYSVLTDKIIREIILQDSAEISVGDRSEWNSADYCRRMGACSENPEANKCKICKTYKEILRKCSSIDYDDQLFLACEILIKHKNVLEIWQKKTKYLLVDEYQDINQAQYELIRLLTLNQTEGLFAVGDDDQSIYSFRGGSPEFILNFESLYEGDTKIGRLYKSWRCPEHILTGAKNVISDHYKESSYKPEPEFDETLTTNNKIIFFDVPSYTVATSIVSKISLEKAASNKINILIPNSNYFPMLKDSLIRRKIPFNYKRKPNSDGIVKFLKLNKWNRDINNNLLLRYIIHEIIINNNEILKSFKEVSGIINQRNHASSFIANLWSRISSNSLYELLNSLQDDFADELSSVLAELHKLMNDYNTRKIYLPKYLELCGQYLSPGKNISNFLSEINDLFNDVYFAQTDSSIIPVEIYNLPSSKGLEADIVFVIGTTEGIIPNYNNPIPEQSRLFYVAMTRAKKELYLFHSRTMPGSITFSQNSFQLKSSSFFKSIDKKHYDYKYIKSFS